MLMVMLICVMFSEVFVVSVNIVVLNMILVVVIIILVVVNVWMILVCGLVGFFLWMCSVKSRL